MKPIGGKFYQRIGNFAQGLFITYKYRLVPPGKLTPYGGASQTTASTSYIYKPDEGRLYEFILPSDKILKSKEFLLYKDNQFFKVNKLSQVSKLFPEKAKAIKIFIKTNQLDWSKKDDVCKIIGFCFE